MKGAGADGRKERTSAQARRVDGRRKNEIRDRRGTGPSGSGNGRRLEVFVVQRDRKDRRTDDQAPQRGEEKVTEILKILRSMNIS